MSEDGFFGIPKSNVPLNDEEKLSSNRELLLKLDTNGFLREKSFLLNLESIGEKVKIGFNSLNKYQQCQCIPLSTHFLYSS